jgi:uncharacterized protein (UPF0248 family)
VSERTVRELLNRLRWDAGEDAAGVELDFVARGEAGERFEAARFAEVVEILPAGVVLSGGTFIPYHRLRCVRRGRETLWRAREKRGGDEG